MDRIRKPQRLSKQQESELHQELLQIMNEEHEKHIFWTKTKILAVNQQVQSLERRLVQLCSEWGRTQ
jgi:polyhydroxyalkanoate synthesis regulator phasin